MKYVYAFREGNRDQKYLLGGKGANLAEMTSMGLPVPPGFTITTDACKAYMAAGNKMPDGLMDEVAAARAALEAETGKRLGDEADPLLVSVRSGAAFSMPGMMDTVLNLGLNDTSVKGLAKQTGNERFAQDSYRRFVQMFGKIVLGIPGDRLRGRPPRGRRRPRASPSETDLRPTTWPSVVETFKGIVKEETGADFPQDPDDQLAQAIEAVFRSWNGRRARDYRRMEKIPDDLGTAVNVQTMVFGNKGEDSGTGVAFTRNPATGERAPYGDFLTNAQGEDVVAGIRVTEPLDAMAGHFPEPHAQLLENMADPREPLPRHVRHRVHHRAGQALHAPDPGREAHRRRRPAHGGRDGGRGPDRAERGRAAGPAGPARPAAPPPVRPQGQLHGHRQGPQRLARAPPWAPSTSPPTTPRSTPRRGRRSSSSGPRPPPTTSTA